MRVVGIVDPFSPLGPVLGEKSFFRGPSGKWAQEMCATGEPDKQL